MGRIIQFLDKRPVRYSVHFTHLGNGQFQLMVEGVSDEERSRLAVADDLEQAAKLLREEIENPNAV